MKRFYFFVIIALGGLVFVGCSKPYFEVDIEQLQEKIYDPTAQKYEVLGSKTVLYLDHSTCVIDARKNSPVFNALKPQLGQYSDTLCLIKGDVFETIPLNRSDNKVFEILETIQKDIPYSDILKAVEQICNSNQQAILITDCEFIKGNLYHDGDPYLSEPFINWLQKGHVIYVVTEPYQEKNKGKIYDKKRFYFIFTDDKIDAPISDNLLYEIEQPIKDNLCTVFKLTNSDLFVQREGKMFLEDLDISDVEQKKGFEYVEVYDDWNTIREYVMKLDEYGELLDNDEGTGKADPLPFIQNLVFNEGENYVITDVEVVATNITAQYVALEDETVKSKVVSIPDGFIIDKSALKNNQLNVMVTEKIFNYLSDEFGGNLIRIDFVVTQTGLNLYDPDMFTWQSIHNKDKAICVAKSIENVLMDVEIRPTSPDRRVIHTVFIKTASYK